MVSSKGGWLRLRENGAASAVKQALPVQETLHLCPLLFSPELEVLEEPIAVLLHLRELPSLPPLHPSASAFRFSALLIFSSVADFAPFMVAFFTSNEAMRMFFASCCFRNAVLAEASFLIPFSTVLLGHREGRAEPL